MGLQDMVAKLTQLILMLREVRLQQCLASSLAQQLKHSFFEGIDCSDDAGQPDWNAELNAVAISQTNQYLKVVQEYNVTVRYFPSYLTAMAFGSNFSDENEKQIAKPPKAVFGSAPSQPQGNTKGTGK